MGPIPTVRCGAWAKISGLGRWELALHYFLAKLQGGIHDLLNHDAFVVAFGFWILRVHILQCLLQQFADDEVAIPLFV